MKRSQVISRLAALWLLLAIPLAAQDAAAVLNRYIQVTGGADVYKRYNVLHLFYSVTGPDKTSVNVDYFHSRNGKTSIETDTGITTLRQGVTGDVAWKYEEGKAAQILSGKQAARLLAQSKGFDEDDWRLRYPTVSLLPNQSINGTPCRHLKLARIDGSIVERFYEIKSGLLIRELSSEIDESGVERPLTIDMERYDSFLGIRRPTVLHIKAGNQTTEIQVNTVTYSPREETGAFNVPQDLVRAIMASRVQPGGLPSPIELIDQFVAATGGKAAYAAIKSQSVKAEVSFKAENLTFPIVSYTEGGKHYSSADIPSIGKYESGDDGQTGWEKSVIMGPKLRPHAEAASSMGPEPEEILKWSNAALEMETLSQDQLAGKLCYRVRLGPKADNTPTACFDTVSKLIVNVSQPDVDEMAEQFFSGYSNSNGLLICHHIETKVAGRDAVIDIKEIAINQPLPSGVFDLPSDIQALKAKREAKSRIVPAAPGAPVLKRPGQAH